MRRSSLATALLLLVQTDASCLSWTCSTSGYGASTEITNGGITYSYCCSGYVCSAASDCTGSTTAASPPSPSPTSSLSNACTDLDDGATDIVGWDCSDYTTYPSLCGEYDDADFSSSRMCCACGGGAASQSPAYFTVAGPCTLDGACVRSPNYPSDYGDS